MNTLRASVLFLLINSMHATQITNHGFTPISREVLNSGDPFGIMLLQGKIRREYSSPTTVWGNFYTPEASVQDRQAYLEHKQKRSYDDNVRELRLTSVFSVWCPVVQRETTTDSNNNDRIPYDQSQCRLVWFPRLQGEIRAAWLTCRSLEYKFLSLFLHNKDIHTI